MSTTCWKPCVICGEGTSIKAYLTAGEGEEHLLLRCRQCGLVYVNEPVRENVRFELAEGEGELAEQWAEQFPDALDVYGDTAWGTTFQDTDDVMRWQRRAVEDAFGEVLDRPGTTLIEVGCARGYLIRELTRRHPGLRVIGVEPSPEMAAKGRAAGLEIINGLIEDVDLPEGSLDGLVAFGSFIQIRDPLSALRHINPIMKPGAKILLDSPNDDSLFRMLARSMVNQDDVLSALRIEGAFDKFVRQVYNPDRFFYYTPKTYGKLLDAAGFSLTRVKTRQPRYLIYGKAGLSSPLRAAAGVMSLLEKLTRKEAWIEVVGEKRSA